MTEASKTNAATEPAPAALAALAAPDPLSEGKVPSERCVLEDFTRCSESHLWKLMMSFYDRKGVESWSQGIVPHFITCNAFIGRAYAKVGPAAAARRARRPRSPARRRVGVCACRRCRQTAPWPAAPGGPGQAGRGSARFCGLSDRTHPNPSHYPTPPSAPSCPPSTAS